ncbi:DNA-binding transcriptional regulator, MerR family [Pseudomonas flavescens]|uniref:DNA-binding transcriptional regulator, MerR family n=1 Tax=Phytopseudomonas flavescens TaxID=29435 RepID=A0A1G8FDY6_9GAMM|nr:MerR family DNA-binding protein [Pseudomonas flavescens]SDH80315.1 DNA-binding transcriptional regulator, MerR family [Pseudomonas flavescens]
MRIGELERSSGASRHTLRYYETLGLIQARRLPNNYRDYPDHTLEDLRFIQGGQRMGFSLEEIGSILHARRQQQIDCAQGALLIAAKLQQIESRIAELNAMRDDLRQEHQRLQASAAAQAASTRTSG